MKVYEFTLVIETQAGLDDGLEDALFEAGCDDATLSFRKGIAYLNFDRDSKDLESAIISAIQQVEETGLNLWVKRVEPSDLVTSAEIARRFGRSRQSIQQLISGARGEGDFPLPVGGVTTKTMLWSWQEVTGWFLKKGKLQNKTIYENATTLKQINESLESRKNELHLKNINRITKLLKKRTGEFA
ncbi:MAG: hypothetical protein WD607_06490 [Candidatus Paceibacterota bacterium]